MAKNNKLINSLKEIAWRNREEHIQQQGNYVIPIIYAGVALALHNEYGWGHKRINRAFMYSQDLWQQIYDGRLQRETMLEWCYEQTGIQLMNPEQAKEAGYDVDA